MTEREFATDVVRRLQAAGFRALWAGGCVRDELLGLTPADYDVASDATPEQVKGNFRRCVEVGAAFGVIEVLGPRGDDGEWLKVQVATFRNDGHYSDGRRPDAVTFSSPEEDAQRRDFTVNGMFFDPIANQVIDYVGGQADLRAKVLRAIGDPTARFTEDKLRILRAVRMATRFELAIDPATLDAARRMASQIRVVSAERIAEELRKLFAHRYRARGAELLREFGLLSPVLPEVPSPDVRLLTALPPDSSFPLAFAAVLLPVGKKVAGNIAKRLKLSNDEKDRIEWLVDRHVGLRNAASLRPSQRHPLLTHPGVGDLLALTRAEGFAADADFCEAILHDTPPEVLDPPPLLTGDDLVAMGWKPGPLFKRVLETVRQKQLDGELQTAADATTFAEGMKP
ncbi:CCA tRNA nucleotidyltransferase [Limnoglobus roseus]|uniref:CCA tRNA nucleotidyltransferase n=1 Tax=Limnoglobus roseus TaxID=2598579 RepID=A0A5C1AAF3_9BACT|nr:CCA tRNA nucleotidyltransferase [Limnoglobus roseus]QEL15197.1 CCA tRNA nucleotidyltransferase [Limnoglobus roseus]